MRRLWGQNITKVASLELFRQSSEVQAILLIFLEEGGGLIVNVSVILDTMIISPENIN